MPRYRAHAGRITDVAAPIYVPRPGGNSDQRSPNDRASAEANRKTAKLDELTAYLNTMRAENDVLAKKYPAPPKQIRDRCDAMGLAAVWNEMGAGDGHMPLTRDDIRWKQGTPVVWADHDGNPEKVGSLTLWRTTDVGVEVGLVLNLTPSQFRSITDGTMNGLSVLFYKSDKHLEHIAIVKSPSYWSCRILEIRNYKTREMCSIDEEHYSGSENRRAHESRSRIGRQIRSATSKPPTGKLYLQDGFDPDEPFPDGRAANAHELVPTNLVSLSSWLHKQQ